MKRLPQKAVVLALVLALTGCATPHQMLNRAVVHNATSGIITDVRVVHEPTGKSGKVSTILPRRSLEIGFSEHPMLGRHAIVTWKDQDGMRRKAGVALPSPKTAAKEGRAMTLVYIIEPAGNVSVQLEQSDMNK